MKKYRFSISLFFFLSYPLFAQTVDIKDGSSNTLLQINDEGAAGSLTLPSLSSITSPAGKLYNLGSVLYWGATALGSSGSAGGWTNTTGKIFNTTLTDQVGIGTNNPLSVLSLRTKDNWNPAVGNGWGDFSISDGTKGLAIGMAEFGGGAGDIRIWAKGGTGRIMIGDVANGDILTTVDGKVGIGISSPTEKLEVNGQVKITGGSPGAGKVLTSDANGLAAWEDNANPKVGFSAYLSTTTIITNATETKLTGFTEFFDNNNSFNNSTGEFTAPSNGIYQFNFTVGWSSSSSVTDVPTMLRIRKNSNVQTGSQFTKHVTLNSSYGESSNLTFIRNLSAGDIITFHVFYTSSSALNVSGGGSTAATTVSVFKVY